MAGWILLVLLALLFAYIDVWYFMRMISLCLYFRVKSSADKKNKRRSKEELFAPYFINGIVLPSDLDHMRHMNNSKYLREMDFGRIALFVESGLYRAFYRCGGTISLTAHCVRYRRPLTLFHRFVLQTRIICWDEDAIYVEQRMTRKSDDFVCAINLAKLAVRGTSISAALETLLGERLASPPFPLELEKWTESITASSNKLKEERNRNNTKNHFS